MRDMLHESGGKRKSWTEVGKLNYQRERGFASGAPNYYYSLVRFFPDERRHIKIVNTFVTRLGCRKILGRSRCVSRRGGYRHRCACGHRSYRRLSTEAGGNHSDFHCISHRLVDHMAKNNIRVFVSFLTHERGCFVYFKQRQIATTSELDEHTPGPLNRSFFEQRR